MTQLAPSIHTRAVGGLLREWRQRRRLSQLDLACEARISTRHLSFLETGRAQPSRDMVLHLAERLDVPIRERNLLLIAAGFAPSFGERSLDDPALASVRAAIDMVLERQRPYPAFAIDRHWRVVASNSELPELYEGCAEDLLRRPINALRLTLHPRGMAPRIANLAEWRAHILARLKQQIDLTGDTEQLALRRELLSYPAPPDARETAERPVAIPFQVKTSLGLLSFFTTTTIFGTPVDVTLSELALELFFPADAATARAVERR